LCTILPDPLFWDWAPQDFDAQYTILMMQEPKRSGRWTGENQPMENQPCTNFCHEEQCSTMLKVASVMQKQKNIAIFLWINPYNRSMASSAVKAN